MRLKLIHHRYPFGHPNTYSWTEVVDADTGKPVESVEEVTVTYTRKGVVATVELIDIEVQTVIEQPPERREGPDL